MQCEVAARLVENIQPSCGQADMPNAEESTWSSGSSACDVPVLREALPGSSTLCSVSSADCTPLSSPFTSQRASTSSSYPTPAALASQLEALRTSNSQPALTTTQQPLSSSKQSPAVAAGKHLPLSMSASSSEGGGGEAPKEGRRSPALLLRPPDKVFDKLLLAASGSSAHTVLPSLRGDTSSDQSAVPCPPLPQSPAAAAAARCTLQRSLQEEVSKCRSGKYLSTNGQRGYFRVTSQPMLRTTPFQPQRFAVSGL
jgi:hypothetical protein